MSRTAFLRNLCGLDGFAILSLVITFLLRYSPFFGVPPALWTVFGQCSHQTAFNLLNTASAVAALAAGDNTVARFTDSLLLEGSPPRTLQARIESFLCDAFPGATFKIAANTINQ